MLTLPRAPGPYSTIMQVGAGSGPPPEGSTVVVLTTEESLDGAGLPAGQAAEFAAKSGALAIAYDVSAGVAAGASRVIAAGLGPAAEVTSASQRSAVAAAVGALKSAEVTEAYAVLPADTGLDAARVAADATVAAVLADYSFDIYITDEERLFHLSMLTLLSDADIDDAVAGAFAVAQGQCTARDLANTRAGVATPEYMEARAADLCADFPSLSLSTVDVDEMMEKGMGLIVSPAAPFASSPRGSCTKLLRSTAWARPLPRSPASCSWSTVATRAPRRPRRSWARACASTRAA